MPGFVKATVILARANGLPEDSVVNSFYFGNDASDILTSAGADELKTRLVSFYNTVHAPGVATIGAHIGEQISRAANASRIDFYATDELEPPATWGSPVQTRTWSLDNAVAGLPLPAETAGVLAYHGDLTDIPETATNPDPPPSIIRPASRLRGRLFIGPLQSNAGSEDGTTHELELSTGFTNALVGAASFLVGANTADYNWVGQSRSGGFFFLVEGGFVDNAFDTQRRRGNQATARTNWV